MAVFSTNQNRHLFVVGAYQASTLSNKKDITLKNTGKELYFLYKGEDTVVKSPMIQLKNLDYVKVIAAADQQIKLKKIELTLADAAKDNGAPIAGQDYVLRIAFRQFYGMSDQDQYFKDAAVHATSSMSASDFYKKLRDELNSAFSREVGATKTANPYLSFSVDDNSTATKLIIEEKPQDYTLGIQSQERVYFDVVPTTIFDGSEDVVWGTITDVTSSNSNVIKNGKKVADLEWFCMGERGDQYRMMGYPNYVPTKYFADPDAEYDLVELHFAFTDTGVNSYRSEKDITIACATTSSNAAAIALTKAIQTAAGITAEKSEAAKLWTWT